MRGNLHHSVQRDGDFRFAPLAMTSADDHSDKTPCGIARRNGLDGSAWSCQKCRNVLRQYLTKPIEHARLDATYRNPCRCAAPSASRSPAQTVRWRLPARRPRTPYPPAAALAHRHPTARQRPQRRPQIILRRVQPIIRLHAFGQFRPMRLDLRRDTAKIRGDELPPQRRIVAAQALQPLLRRRHARGVIADRQRHRIRRHRLAVQPQRLVAHLRTAQPRIVQRDRARQTIEAIRNPQRLSR